MMEKGKEMADESEAWIDDVPVDLNSIPNRIPPPPPPNGDTPPTFPKYTPTYLIKTTTSKQQ